MWRSSKILLCYYVIYKQLFRTKQIRRAEQAQISIFEEESRTRRSVCWVTYASGSEVETGLNSLDATEDMIEGM